MLNYRGQWYLIAWDERRRAVRDFALHRIRQVTVTEAPSAPAAGFDLQKYMADAFHLEKGGQPANVVIRFAPRQARWIRERRWHRSARVQERLDGGCVLRMRVAVTSELVRWVLQYGPEAEVLAPKRLRREVVARLSQTIASYEGPPVPAKRARQDQRAYR